MIGALNAVAFYILVSVFAPGKEREYRFPILFIAVAVVVTQYVMVRYVPLGNVWLSLALALAASAVVAVVALMLVCKIETKAAIKITASYLGVSVLLAFVTAFLFGR